MCLYIFIKKMQLGKVIRQISEEEKPVCVFQFKEQLLTWEVLFKQKSMSGKHHCLLAQFSYPSPDFGHDPLWRQDTAPYRP